MSSVSQIFLVRCSLSSVGLNWLVATLGVSLLLLLFGDVLFLLTLLLLARLGSSSRWTRGALVLLLVSLALRGLRLELLGAWSSLVERHCLSLEHLLLVHHVGRELVVLALVSHWHWLKILVWVEPTEASGESSELGQIRDLDHGSLLLVELGVWWRSGVELSISLVVASTLLVVMLHLLWHWGKSHTLWEVWKWVDQLSSLLLGVVEGASLTKLAFSLIEVVLAWLRLVVGVDGAEGSLSKVLGEWLSNIRNEI
jgi:hypothetical protein